jgi:intracellular multiplication protein IcmB
LELGPLEPQPFRALKEKMNRTLPWRIRFDIEPGGLDKTRGRRTLLSFTAMFPGNTIIRDSFNELIEMDKDDPACTMRVVAATWGKTKAQAKERRSALTKALQSWGVCQTRVEHGDPVEAFGSSIAAFSTASAGTMMYPPLGDALEMMPLQRPATPWASDGDFVQRTPEGKIYPIGLASSQQDVDIRVVAAEPGSGKSMMLGSMNFATAVRPGARRLPLITILDVGISGVSQVEMIQDSLPPSRSHEALAIRVTNSAEYAVNPFDTQLGADAPTRQEEDYLVDFLGCLLMNTQTMRPPSADCGRLALALIKNVYKEKLLNAPAPYERDVDPAIEACLDSNGLRQKRDDQWWADATWKEVRDLLFVEGHRREASLAHSRAMPTLPDFNAALLSKDIESIYGTARTDTSERLLDYAQRAFTAARDQFAIFAGRTRFELNSETRVLCLDLQSVIGSTTNEGRLRTQIMFLFGRHMAARNYFLDDKELQEVLPANKIYHEYHMARWADVKDEQKFIVYDELHNIGKPNAEFNPVYDRMEKDGRENRKWGVSVVASSQYLTDFPAKLLNAATSIYVMRGGAIENERVLRESFKVSDEAIRRLNLEATGPGPQGGNYLAIFKTKVGRIVQMLNNTPGPVELWAFTTTPDDMALRRRLYKAIGPSQARTLLARRFKTGSAGSVINAMKRDIRADDAGNVIDKLAEELLDEYRKPHNDHSHSGAQ